MFKYHSMYTVFHFYLQDMSYIKSKLSTSAIGDYRKIAKILHRNLTDGMKVNRAGWSPLMYACIYSHENVVQLMATTLPSCVYIRNRKKQTALMLASSYHDTNIVKLVLQEDLIEWKDSYGWNALFYAAYYGQENVIKLLVAHNININSRDNDGRTALIIAALEGMSNAVALLLSLGADRYISSNSGKIALQFAAERGYRNIVEFLTILPVPDIDSLLNQFSLSKYIRILKENDVDLEKFLQMSEEDLKSIGIRLLGPRRKMSLIITKLNYMYNINRCK